MRVCVCVDSRVARLAGVPVAIAPQGKDADVSELKIAVDQAKADMGREAARTKDIETHYQLQLKAHQDETAKWKLGKDLEANTVLDESHGKRIELECQLRVRSFCKSRSKAASPRGRIACWRQAPCFALSRARRQPG